MSDICDELTFVKIDQDSLNKKLNERSKVTLEEQICNLYIKTFGSAPWHEYMTCKQCEEAGVYTRYSEQEVKALVNTKNLSCKNQNCPTKKTKEVPKLVDFYTFDEARKILQNALSQEGFVGFAATLYNKIITSVAWGFSFPKKDTPTLKISATKQKLEEQGIDLTKVFYSAEIFTLPDLQGFGVGRITSKRRLDVAKESGYNMVLFRTQNPNAINIYAKLFGEENMVKLFPDPVTGSQWYGVELKYLK